MDVLYQKYAIYLDELRIQAGLTELDFCDGVCNDRTYRKYLSGNLVISQKKINAFCKKLGFTSEEFLYSFDKHANEEYIEIIDFFFSIKNKDLEKAKKYLIKYDKTPPAILISKKLYEHCIIHYNQEIKKITEFQAYTRYSDLIGYPDSMSKKYFDIVHILTLQRIAMLEAKTKKEDALNHILSLLNDPTKVFVSVESRKILVSVYAITARLLGMKERIKESLLVAQRGIQYSIEIHNSHDLDNLYYYEALGYYRLDNIENAKTSSMKCLITLVSMNKTKRLQQVYTIMKKSFSDEIMDYINSHTIIKENTNEVVL